MSEEADLETVVAAVKGSRKYGDTSEETIRQLAAEAVRQHKRPKAAIKAVRKRLHSIMAPYLGDPDYVALAKALDAAFASGDMAAVNGICRAALESHLYGAQSSVELATELQAHVAALEDEMETAVEGETPWVWKKRTITAMRAAVDGTASPATTRRAEPSSRGCAAGPRPRRAGWRPCRRG